MHSSWMRTVRSSGCREGGVVFQHAPGRGVCVSQYALGRGMSAPVHAGIHPPDRMTDACENIKYVVAKKI